MNKIEFFTLWSAIMVSNTTVVNDFTLFLFAASFFGAVYILSKSDKPKVE